MDIQKIEEKFKIKISPILNTTNQWLIDQVVGQQDLSITISSSSELVELDKFLQLTPELLEKIVGYETTTSAILAIKLNKDYEQAIIDNLCNTIFEIPINKETIQGVWTKPAFPFTNFELFIFNKILPQTLFENNHILILTLTKGGDELKLSNDDLFKIIDNLKFYYKYNYNFSFTTINRPLSEIKTWEKRSLSSINPKIPFCKNYDSDLIDYFCKISDIQNLPAKYLSYYHIIEYFHDKWQASIQRNLQDKIKKALLKPDINENINEYSHDLLVNVIEKIDAVKGQQENKKTEGVLRTYLDFPDIINITKEIDNIELSEYFTKPQKIASLNEKEFSIEKVKFPSIETEENKKISEKNIIDQFASSVGTRIYKIRCSLVHYNPEFIKDKGNKTEAKPFKYSIENFELLKKEIVLIHHIAQTIISNSPTFNI